MAPGVLRDLGQVVRVRAGVRPELDARCVHLPDLALVEHPDGIRPATTIELVDPADELSHEKDGRLQPVAAEDGPGDVVVVAVAVVEGDAERAVRMLAAAPVFLLDRVRDRGERNASVAAADQPRQLRVEGRGGDAVAGEVRGVDPLDYAMQHKDHRRRHQAAQRSR